MKGIIPQDRYLKINGLRLHYLDWENHGCQTILLLHGFMAHAHVWDDFVLNFQSYYRVIALDQRGHGESQWSGDMAYTLDDHFSDIAHFIEILDLNDLILIGHSMGGRHALFCAACVPHKVDRLILVDARPGNDHHRGAAIRVEQAEGVQKLLQHLSVNRVQFVGAVESEIGDAIFPFQ